MMQQGNRKARQTHEIVCGLLKKRKEKCPRAAHKYRGVHKCWGCPHARWWRSGKPYGPSRRLKP